LKGLKIIELASVLAGPSVGQFFAELGAEVIKVENARIGGDVTRSWLSKSEVPNNTVSAYFSAVNWGKKSITADFRLASEREKIYQIIDDADIVIASYKPGDAEKLFMDFDSLAKRNPKLIYGQITGYGSNDLRVGYDAVIQAESGFMSINGNAGDQPLKMPIAMIDLLAGHHLKEALLIALIERMKTGKGRLVEVSLMDVAISSLLNQGTNWLVGKNIPKTQGNAHPNIAPYGELFLTKDDEKVILAVGNDKQFDRLCAVLDIDSDQRFRTNKQRLINRIVLNGLLAEKIRLYTIEALMPKLHSNQIPAGVYRTIDQVLDEGTDEWFLNSAEYQGLRTFAAKGINKVNLSPPPQLGANNSEFFKALK
jgi:crotonobetainyl-CoA:carnitine CoA-transferase CaiB-like acyl-CoA transferase